MNIEELNTQLEYLKETKNLIKEQLIAKGQPVDDNTPFREYVDNMNDLVDTTDANAVTSDIATGKSGYVDGQKVDGNLRDIASGSASSFIGTNFTVEDKPQFNLLDFTLPFTVDLIHRQGSIERLNVTYDKIATPINLSSGQIKAGETILGIAGSVVELNGDTETVTPTTSQQIITPTSPKNGFTQVTVNAVTSTIDSNIKTENIKSGVTILGVSGKSSVVDTSDANALSSTMLDGYSAYVNGQKVQGTIMTTNGNSTQYIFNKNYDGTSLTKQQQLDNITVSGNEIKIKTGTMTGGLMVAYRWGLPDTKVLEIAINGSVLMEKLGLTQQNLKYGETVLGISGLYTASNNPATANDIITGKVAFVNGQKIIGTYAGSSMKEYASVTDMNNDIANIEAEEVVKVANISMPLPDYYIKSYNSSTSVYEMVKLVKESETISPEEYTENVDIADDILGTD